MTEQTVFSPDQATTTAPEVVTPVTQAPSIPTELVELVGAGKKYSTLDDALKSVPHAQKHISTLEQELADARAELTKRKTAEELLADIQRGISTQGVTTPNVDLTQDVVSGIVKNVINQEKQKEVADLNVKEVINAFQSNFGEKSEEVFIKLASENGLTVAQMNSLAATSPKALLKLAGLTDQRKTPPHMNSSVNTTSLSPQQPKAASAVLPKGATSKDVLSAWEVAKQQVLNDNKG